MFDDLKAFVRGFVAEHRVKLLLLSHAVSAAGGVFAGFKLF
jgi:hypothetical protein